MNTMERLLSKHLGKTNPLERGQLVEGKVVGNDGRNILVDVGGKSEGIVSRREIDEEKLDFSKYEIGRKINVIVNQSETDQGFAILSLKKAAAKKQWEEAKTALAGGKILTGNITDINRGGLVVNLGEISGFVPISQLNQAFFAKVKQFNSQTLKPSDRGLIKQELLKQKIKVKIIEVDQKKNRLVASQRQAVAERGGKRTAEALEKIKLGKVFEGKVTNVTPFGIFVDIGTVEGLAHVSELSWERVSHPAQLFSAGDKLKVKVIEINPKEGKLSLSVKALTENPWDEFINKYKVGSTVSGEAVKIVPYGVFVQVGAGVDAFLHVSETKKPLKVGEKIEAMITELDPTRKRISLSVKRLGKEIK
jgi:small subunit ribosomal protein S1